MRVRIFGRGKMWREKPARALGALGVVGGVTLPRAKRRGGVGGNPPEPFAGATHHHARSICHTRPRVRASAPAGARHIVGQTTRSQSVAKRSDTFVFHYYTPHIFFARQLFFYQKIALLFSLKHSHVKKRG
jgi:hypothetical protein